MAVLRLDRHHICCSACRCCRMKALKRFTKGGDEKVTTKGQQPKEKPQLTASDLAVSCMHGKVCGTAPGGNPDHVICYFVGCQCSWCVAETAPPLLGAVAEVGEAGREAAEPEGTGLCPPV